MPQANSLQGICSLGPISTSFIGHCASAQLADCGLPLSIKVRLLFLTIFNRNITKAAACFLTTADENKQKIMSPQVVRDHGFCAYPSSIFIRLTYMFTMPDRAPHLVVI